MDVHPVLRGITEASQLKLRRAGDKQPIESSHLEAGLIDATAVDLILEVRRRVPERELLSELGPGNFDQKELRSRLDHLAHELGQLNSTVSRPMFGPEIRTKLFLPTTI